MSLLYPGKGLRDFPVRASKTAPAGPLRPRHFGRHLKRDHGAECPWGSSPGACQHGPDVGGDPGRSHGRAQNVLPSFRDRMAADPEKVMTSTPLRFSFRPSLALLGIAGLAGIGGALAFVGVASCLEVDSRREEVRTSVESSSSTGVLEGNQADRAPGGSRVGTDIQEFSVEEGRLERGPPRLTPPAGDRQHPVLRDEPGGGRKPCREGERLEALYASPQNGHGSEEPGISRRTRPRHRLPPPRGAEALRASRPAWRLSRTT